MRTFGIMDVRRLARCLLEDESGARASAVLEEIAAAKELRDFQATDLFHMAEDLAYKTFGGERVRSWLLN